MFREKVRPGKSVTFFSPELSRALSERAESRPNVPHDAAESRHPGQTGHFASPGGGQQEGAGTTQNIPRLVTPEGSADFELKQTQE